MKTKRLLLVVVLAPLFFMLNAQTAKTTTSAASKQPGNNVSQAGALTKNVTVNTPGTLATLITSTEKLKVSQLKISGNIDARDFEVILKKMPALKVLDMSEAKITAYQESPENLLPDYSLISKESLSKIILPATLISIGKSALAYTRNLNEIVLPETLKYIDKWAFSFSGLKSMNIPDGLSTSVLSEFTWCENLTKITVSAESKNFSVVNDILYSKNMDTLYMCPRTKKIAFPELGIDKLQSLKVIRRYAFNYCKGLTGQVILPAQLEIIGENAFYNCSGLSGNPVLPENLKKLGQHAFSGCSGFTGELKIPAGLGEIESGAFSGCSGLTGVLVIPKGITKIGQRSFKWCSGLTGMTLPEGLIEIDDDGFGDCTGFTGKLDIPGSVTRIGKQAFLFCRNFTRINIPERKSVNDPQVKGCYIDTDAFQGCEYKVYIGNRSYM